MMGNIKSQKKRNPHSLRSESTRPRPFITKPSRHGSYQLVSDPNLINQLAHGHAIGNHLVNELIQRGWISIIKFLWNKSLKL